MQSSFSSPLKPHFYSIHPVRAFSKSPYQVFVAWKSKRPFYIYVQLSCRVEERTPCQRGSFPAPLRREPQLFPTDLSPFLPDPHPNLQLIGVEGDDQELRELVKGVFITKLLGIWGGRWTLQGNTSTHLQTELSIFIHWLTSCQFWYLLPPEKSVKTQYNIVNQLGRLEGKANPSTIASNLVELISKIFERIRNEAINMPLHWTNNRTFTKFVVYCITV